MTIAFSIYSRLERSANKVLTFTDLRIILSNLTGLFAVAAILLAAMTILCIVLEEPENIPGFATAFVVSGSIALLLKVLFPVSGNIELRHAMIVAAIAYIVVPAVSMIPFIFIEQMPVVDAFFEAISGWTGTGFSMIMAPEHSSNSILLWRSIMQWIGGLGVILLMVTILIRPGTSTYAMYKSEAHKERIHPSIQSTIKTIWLQYLALTVVGVAMLIVVGMPVWDSINHGMVAIGNGGYSIYADSIMHYNSIPIEIAIMFLMFLGALPFAFLYKTVMKPKSVLSIDPEVKAFLLLILAGIFFVTAELYFTRRDLFESFRLAAFQFLSAVTSGGFQTSMMTDWPLTAMLILSIGMNIGGCAGSTAGGIKVARARFLVSEFELWVKRTMLPGNAIVTVKMGDRRVNEELISKELAEAGLISFLWIATILISVFILSHVVDPSYGLAKVVFTVCSAQSNSGIWCGLIEPGMHIIGKIVLIFDMWIGRLEIIPVMLLLRYLLRGFDL